MDLLIMTNRAQSMNFIWRLNIENFYFLSQSLQICWLISCMKVMEKYKISV